MVVIMMFRVAVIMASVMDRFHQSGQDHFFMQTALPSGSGVGAPAGNL
jgi:hypothetical protein